jgi:type IV pilus assembly protein PilA
MRYRKAKGFTLIELMIAVAIIGVLASISMTAYAKYLPKAQVAAGLAEITAGKTAFETAISQGQIIAAPADIGLQIMGSRCSISAASANPPDGTGNITCTFAATSAPLLYGKKIAWQRAPDSGAAGILGGAWTCTSDVADTSILPKACGGS